MDLQRVADELVAGCRERREIENLDRLYAEDAVSVEAVDYSGRGREIRGREGIRGKHEWWGQNFELHETKVEGPFPHGDDRFAVIFEIEATEKASGKRDRMREVAVYHVADGRIVREEFFYPT